MIAGNLNLFIRNLRKIYVICDVITLDFIWMKSYDTNEMSSVSNEFEIFTIFNKTYKSLPIDTKFALNFTGTM